MKTRILIVCCCMQHALIAGSQVYYWHPSTVLRIGGCLDPYDLTDAKRSAIEYDGVEENLDVAKGAAVTATFSSGIITSAYDLLNTLKIDGNMSAHYLMFSGGGQLHDYEKHHFSSDSLTWYLQAYSDYGRSMLKNPRLTAEAQKLAANPKDFRNAYGTYFVFQQRKASMITVVFSVSHLSTETVKRLSVSLSAAASTPVIGGSFSASYQSAMEEALKTSVISFNVYTRGGQGLTALAGVAKSIDDLALVRSQMASYISTMTSDNAPPVEYEVQRLDTLPGGPQLGTVPNLYDKAMDAYYATYIKCEDALSSLNNVIQTPPQQLCWLSVSDLAQLKASRKTYSDLETQLLKKAQAIRDGKEEPSLETIDVPDTSIPIPTIVLMPPMQGFYGYVVGGNFDHVSFCLGEQTQAIAPTLTLDEFKKSAEKVKQRIITPDRSIYVKNGMNPQQIKNADAMWQLAKSQAEINRQHVDQDVANVQNALAAQKLDPVQRNLFHFNFVFVDPKQTANYNFRLFDCSQQTVAIASLPR